MREQEVRELYEAYLQVHRVQEEVEVVDEAREANRDPEGYEERQRTSQSSRQRRMNDPDRGINSPAFHAFMAQQMGGKKKKVEEETDLFDTILEYLVAEGYADTNEAALVIMANMSEEWRESIVEEVLDEASKTDEFTRAAIARNSGRRGGITFEPGPRWDPSANRGKGANLSPKQKEKKRRKELAQSNQSNMGEGYDIYDTILEYLVTEGYADTNESALVIMANMSEEWRQSIVEMGENIGKEPKTVGKPERDPNVKPGSPKGKSYGERMNDMKPSSMAKPV